MPAEVVIGRWKDTVRELGNILVQVSSQGLLDWGSTPSSLGAGRVPYKLAGGRLPALPAPSWLSVGWGLALPAPS